MASSIFNCFYPLVITIIDKYMLPVYSIDGRLNFNSVLASFVFIFVNMIFIYYF